MNDELLYTQEDIDEWIRTCEELQEKIKEQEEVIEELLKYKRLKYKACLTKEDIQNADINDFLDLLIEFDEMGYLPTTLCKNPEKEAKEFQDRLRKAFVAGIAKILNDSDAEVQEKAERKAEEARKEKLIGE